jgi:hypothetical protein
MLSRPWGWKFRRLGGVIIGRDGINRQIELIKMSLLASDAARALLVSVSI